MSFHAVNQACPLCLQPLYNEKIPGNPDSTEFAKRHVHNKCENVLRLATTFSRLIQGKPPQADAVFIPRNENERKSAIVAACAGATALAVGLAALENQRKAATVVVCAAAVALAALASVNKRQG
ncbi:MAG: hypothetical protein LLG04_10380 [Parachlamydia sp.]|nr:hypothetical protein [Parachlamydia sp.]